jgi:DMSO/TMAO reductase YedYZ molybdopterin-dependent catalytic subunit
MDKHLANIGSAKTNSAVDAEIRRLTRRSFTVGAVSALAGAAGVGWLATRPGNDGVPWPLRRILEFNERVAQQVFSPRRLAPEFPAASAVEPRVNGHVGLMSPAQLANWTVHVTGKVDRQIPLSAIKALPAYEMTTQLKCVEGWDSIVSWKGVRLADFLSKFGVPSAYIGLSTPPDGQSPTGQPDRFYVGFDQPSALHPQTLLCYEMNGAPLTQGHGAPLRLVSTVKYGYKCIKRIGVVELTEQRPADYWAQRGYDWYGGH